MTRLIRQLAFTGLILLGLAGMATGETRGATEGAQVVLLPTTGVVDNVMAGYLREGIATAASQGSPLVVVELNTPGGSLDATNDIVGSILEAPVPVVVWVAPAGGRAASAGTFITLSAHIALMAPGTSIGAASPVGSGGQDIPGTLGQKVMNDAIAKIRGIAEERGRNVDWAESAVRNAASASATQAVQVGAVDGIAANIDQVLAFANGKTVTVAGKPTTIDVTGATVSELSMNPFQAFLHLLSDENIAALLFSVGSLGLVYELISPNFVTGILGGLAIILAFIGFGSLPLNVGGLLLIALAMLLFVLETSVVSHGLLAIGGLICFVLGASALYTAPTGPFEPDVAVATPLIVTMAVTIGLFMLLAITTVVRSRRRARLVAASYGAGGSTSVPSGTVGEVRRPLIPIGSVFAAGEEWSARTADDRPLDRGTAVRVVGDEGLTLIVEPVGPSGPGA